MPTKKACEEDEDHLMVPQQQPETDQISANRKSSAMSPKNQVNDRNSEGNNK